MRRKRRRPAAGNAGAGGAPGRGRRSGKAPRRAGPLPGARDLDAADVEALRAELERRAAGLPRWNADPDEVRRAVAKLALTLIEFLRALMERQAIRRMEAGTLTAEETERLGLALMRLEETIRELAARFGLDPEELTLDLGPLGRLK
jgi:hypothetical protein